MWKGSRWFTASPERDRNAVTRPITVEPEEEPLSEEDIQAVAASGEYFLQNPGGGMRLHLGSDSRPRRMKPPTRSRSIVCGARKDSDPVA